MHDLPVVVVGAGIGGLSAALALACRGIEVVVVEKNEEPGGKMRQLCVGGASIDSGPTVFTMREVFDEIFAEAGSNIADHLQVEAADILARHAWSSTERLDLFADRDRSAEAIAELCGQSEAHRYLEFCRRAKDIFSTLENNFIRAHRPNPLSLVLRGGPAQLPALMRIKPFGSLWAELGGLFQDPRLRQLFGRYATYCGSSPYHAPATLMLVSHVEQRGVWIIDGGMSRLASTLKDLAQRLGVVFKFGDAVDSILSDSSGVRGVACRTGLQIDCSAVICNADPAAIASGALGAGVKSAVDAPSPAERSLSAVTFSGVAEVSGFELAHHNVFFSTDYRREFDDIFRTGRIPGEPTVYICAQDRGPFANPAPGVEERLFFLVNAPAIGDRYVFTAEDIETCKTTLFATLERCGLATKTIPANLTVTTPSDFANLFPATGGALYGQASHGWKSSFSRPGSRTKIPRLYLAGGGVHPGPGVPMAAISGRLAVQSLLADRDSTYRFRTAAMPGGTSTQ